ncbi:MAG: hypothetical protein R6T83_00650 [Salinibacter sp.]
MKLIAEYFGPFVFGFVVFMAGLVALPPSTSIAEVVGMGLAFVVIAGGFTWYYSSELSSGEPGNQPVRRPPQHKRPDDAGS